MNYSEGPWYVDVQTDNTIVEGRYQTVADKVSNRDADLIAAAPDLYEALKEITKAEEISPELWNQIHCALLKAEGK